MRHCEIHHFPWPGYIETPLLDLPDIAEAAGIKRILYKDESSRLGLGAFKALGGAYAVRNWYDAQMAAGVTGPLAVSTATDGNHGRSVAWGAQLLGIECHIFIHAGVSQNRADSMSELGATVPRVAATMISPSLNALRNHHSMAGR